MGRKPTGHQTGHAGKVSLRPRQATPLSQYRPSSEWIESCGTVVEMTKQILSHTLGAQWTVVPQGSFVQGLQVSGSDLDLVLLDGTERWRTLSRDKNADQLEQAVRRLTRSQWEGFPVKINVIRKIYRARVPLARLRVFLPSTRQEVEVDMCFGDPSRGLCDLFVHRLVSRVEQLETFCLAMKVWANKRGLTETHTGGISCFAVVLLAMYYYRGSGLHFASFFEFFLSLRHKPKMAVSIETQRLVPRPPDGERDLLYVIVPCRENENAARCLRLAIWHQKLVPELRRAVAVCKAIPEEKLGNIEFVLQQLLNRADVKYSYQESESEGTSSEDEKDIIHLGDNSEDEPVVDPVMSVRDESHEKIHVIESNSSSDDASSIDSDTFVNRFNNPSSSLARHPPSAGDGRAISIQECEECNYFAFNAGDLRNHYYAVHGYPKRNRDVAEPRDRYRLTRRFRQRIPDGSAVPTERSERRRRNAGGDKRRR